MFVAGTDQKLLELINQLLISRSNGMRVALIEDQNNFLRWLLADRPYRKRRIAEVANFCSGIGAKDKYKSEVAAALIAGLHNEQLKVMIIEERVPLIEHFDRIKNDWSRHPRSHESLIIIEILLDHLKDAKVNL